MNYHGQCFSKKLSLDIKKAHLVKTYPPEFLLFEQSQLMVGEKMKKKVGKAKIDAIHKLLYEHLNNDQ